MSATTGASDHDPMPTHAVILAGGRGTRLGAIGRAIPKPLVPIQGVPVIVRLMCGLREEGVEAFTVVTHHRADVIEAQLGDGRDLGVRINYLREPKPLGTAGCLGLLDPPDRAFFLVNADILTDLSFWTLARKHVTEKASATIAVHRHTTSIDYGTVEFDADGRLLRYREKPVLETFIGMGLSCLSPRVCDHVDRDEVVTLPEILDRLLAAGETVLCHRHDGLWCDIGRPDDYERCQTMILPPILTATRHRAA